MTESIGNMEKDQRIGSAARAWRSAVPLLGAWLSLFGSFATAQDASDGPLIIEAYVVETSEPIFDSPNALVRAAGGDTSGLIRGGGGGDLAAQLQAAEHKGHLRILASPQLLTRFGEEVSAKSGVTFAVHVVARDTVTVQFKDAVLGIEIRPSLGADDLIELSYELNKDSPRYDLPSDEEPGIIQTTSMDGKAIVRDGGTGIAVGSNEIKEADFAGGPQLVLFITARRVSL